MKPLDDSDWKVDIDDPPQILPVPSFIRLFLTNRVLKEANTGNGNTIENLVIKSDINIKLHEQAKKILLQLINDGIKNFMEKYYDEQTQSIVCNSLY